MFSGATDILQARWVASMETPPQRDGAVAVDARSGRIVQVGSAAELLRAYPDCRRWDYPSAVLTPGLVNAHTHLELSNQQRDESFGGSLAQWLIQRVRNLRDPAAQTPRVIAAAALTGARQSAGFGVSCVGDISRQFQCTRAALASGPLRVVSFGEVVSLGRGGVDWPQRVDEILAAAPTDWMIPGISPHAPYTVDAETYAQVIGQARKLERPWTTHLAESADERPFLFERTGPLMDLWAAAGGLDQPFTPFADGPIHLLARRGILAGGLLAHVNYCDDGEMQALAAAGAAVVYCPRTHQYFAHPPHRFERMLQLGINVCLGTDSLASSPDLDLTEEMRLVRRQAPQLSAQSIWHMATAHGAAALGLTGRAGVLRPGAWADIAVFTLPIPAADPLETLLRQPAQKVALWVNGKLLESR